LGLRRPRLGETDAPAAGATDKSKAAIKAVMSMRLWKDARFIYTSMRGAIIGESYRGDNLKTEGRAGVVRQREVRDG